MDRNKLVLGLLVAIALLTAGVHAQDLPEAPDAGARTAINNDAPTFGEARITYHTADGRYVHDIQVADGNGPEDITELLVCPTPETCNPITDDPSYRDRAFAHFFGVLDPDTFDEPPNPDTPWTLIASDTGALQAVTVVTVDTIETASTDAIAAAANAERDLQNDDTPDEAPPPSTPSTNEEAPSPLMVPLLVVGIAGLALVRRLHR